MGNTMNASVHEYNSPAQKRVREFEEKRRMATLKGGFELASYVALGTPCDEAFVATIRVYGTKSFTVEYDGWGGEYVYAGKLSLVAEFARFASEVINPLYIEQETAPVMKKLMESPTWNATDILVADMIDDSMR